MPRCLAAIVVLLSLPALADLKITVSNSGRGATRDVTIRYYQGQRSRTDWRNSSGWSAGAGDAVTVLYGPQMATIYQCDMHRVLELDLDRRQYTVQDLDENGAPAKASSDMDSPRRPGGEVRVSYDVHDTGERRFMFNREARRLILTTRQVAGPGACVSSQETVEDGWFIAFEEPAGNCQERQSVAKARRNVVLADNCSDHYTFEGPPLEAVGYPLQVTTTVKPAGTQPKARSRSAVHTETVQVVELSDAPLDPALFELPTGFKHVDKLSPEPSPSMMQRARMTWESVKHTVKGWWPW